MVRSGEGVVHPGRSQLASLRAVRALPEARGPGGDSLPGQTEGHLGTMLLGGLRQRRTCPPSTDAGGVASKTPSTGGGEEVSQDGSSGTRWPLAKSWTGGGKAASLFKDGEGGGGVHHRAFPAPPWSAPCLPPVGHGPMSVQAPPAMGEGGSPGHTSGQPPSQEAAW